MSKIQSIKRPNGTTAEFVYLTKEALELSELKKGDEVHFSANKDKILMVKK